MAKANSDSIGIKSSSSRYISAVIFTAIAAVLYFFWAVPYRAALSYREQLQLFQTTLPYFTELAGRPGGPATYLGEFLTQFFNNFRIGAAVMSGMLLLIMMTFRFIIRRFSQSLSDITAVVLSAVPLIALLLYLGNPDVTLTFATSLLIVTASASLFIITANRSFSPFIKYLLMAVCVSILYWLAGPTDIVFLVIVSVYEWKNDTYPLTYKISFTIISLLCLVVNIYIWSYFLPYPLSYQMIGIGYLMLPDRLYAGQIIVEIIFVLVPLAAIFIGKLPQKVSIPALIAAEVLTLVLLYPQSYDKTTYRLIDYDYMVRANDWEGILEYSDSYGADLPLSVSATNLACGMTGQLDSRAFDYFQHGAEGLIPPFIKETLSSWTTGEILYQLGLVNSAQRFYFEGMEVIPNYNKSSRAIKRLAECSIIRGEYALAEKYLSLLENTLFYRKWARRNLELIKESGLVETHPLYGLMRRRMITEDYLFSESELDKSLGQLFIKDPDNSLARQYLIVYPLLQRDLDKFMQYMGVVAEHHSGYNPLLAQQALAFISMKNGQPIPRNVVSPMVEKTFQDFARAWTSRNRSLIEPYRHSLFYYLLSDE